MPVPFSPFRTKSRGFDPYAETPRGQSEPKSPPLSPLGAGGPPQEEHDLKPPEPPQLVLPSLLSRRMSSIVQVPYRLYICLINKCFGKTKKPPALHADTPCRMLLTTAYNDAEHLKCEHIRRRYGSVRLPCCNSETRSVCKNVYVSQENEQHCPGSVGCRQLAVQEQETLYASMHVWEPLGTTWHPSM